MVADRMPTKPEVHERVLVADLAETMSVHGYKVMSHTTKQDHEREETTLTVKFVKSSGAEKQGNLKLHPDASPAGEGAGS